MTNRPYISKQIADLELLVEETFDLDILKKISGELCNRSLKKRNMNLSKKVSNKIATLKKEAKAIVDVEVSVSSEVQKNQELSDKVNKPQPKEISNMPHSVKAAAKAPSKTIYPEGFLADMFESMRKKLLDTSGGRSRLLNLKQDTKGFVRIVDELPNQLAELLLSNKSLTMDYVPDPTQRELVEHGYIEWDAEEKTYIKLKEMPKPREWAKILGIKVDYDLPLDSVHVNDGRHDDTDVQTILFASGLTTSLKKLAKDAKTSIEETGNNILFLSLGFLEWADQVKGNKRLAPLFMIPVSIDKTNEGSITHYQIRFTGEDIIPNLTLREKLNQDFEVQLPGITSKDDDDKLLTPEEYFNEVEKLLELKSNDASMQDWKVRRYGTLATLSLGRLLMYRDLDPERWPQGEDNLVNHDFIKKFFSDGHSSPSTSIGSGGAYVLDDVSSLHDYFPMVEDADSSQMSALIDILKGENLVVEGPPGTGKSQTITNLIAAAISQGKSVLFVAEKQAALDVVKRRMDKAGLGDFCLDLHSDKAQKRLVLDSFNERVHFENRHDFSNSDYLTQVRRYERSREQLQNYCLMVNKPWKNTGFTIHEILCGATRYAKDVEPLEYHTIAPEGLTGASFTRESLDEQLEQLELFFKYLDIVSKQLPKVGEWSSHPWYGVNNKQLSSMGEKGLLNELVKWTDALQLVSGQALAIFEEFGLTVEGELSLESLDYWAEQLGNLKPLTGNEYLPAFKAINAEDVAPLKNALVGIMRLSKGYIELGDIFNQGILSDFSQLNTIRSAIQNVEQLGVLPNVQFDDMAKSIKSIELAIESTVAVEHKLSELLPHLPIAYKADLEKIFTLSSVGLTELAGFIEHTLELPKELISNRNDLYDEESLPLTFKELKKEVETLLAEKLYLETTFNLVKVPSIESVDEYAKVMANVGFLSFFSGTWRKAKKAVVAFSNEEKVDKKTIAENLERLTAWLLACIKLKEHNGYIKAFATDFDGIDTDLNRIETIMQWYGNVRKDYGIGFGSRTVMANALFNLNKDIFRGIQQLHSNNINTEIKDLVRCLDSAAVIYSKKACFTDKSFDLSPAAEPLKITLSEILESLRGIQQYLVNPNIDQKELLQALAKLEKLSELSEKLNKANIAQRYFDSSLDLTVNSKGKLPEGLEAVEATVGYLDGLYSSITDKSLIAFITQISASYGNKEEAKARLNNLIEKAQAFKSDLADGKAFEAEFFSLIEGDIEHWAKSSSTEVEALVTRNQLAIDNIEWLDGWTKYLYAKDRMQQGGQGRLKDYLSDSDFTIEYGKQVMNFAVYTCWANEVYQEQPELSQRSGHEQTAIQEQFKKYDDELKAIQRKRVAQLALDRVIDQGTSGARVSSYTGAKLLHHEMDKKSRHVAIRKLVSRAGDAMLGYKPCFMMSPMAVAKYLPPGELEFDLVVMDEASQVKPEFALSCFARGKQAVVVGDPKQLPPTSFFERATSNDEDEDESEKGVINESESILEAIGAHYPKRMLQWHYRSRHESLIDFSNRHFYDSELVIFPSPWAQSDEFGIKFNYVESGVFVNNVNNEEAKQIVEAVKSHLTRNPDESIGIVAMNTKQRDQIEAAIDAERSKDPALEAAFQRDLQTEEPLFIKNLENVQGDERDVIIISFTYGPQNRGSNSVPQRFGPINSEQGWRRLNVLFTRAKKRIQIYSSMRSGNILVSETSKRGVKALKNYLAYAETGELVNQSGVAQGTPDSDFEIAVIKQLEQAGFECVPQVGVAGFKIDIGVRDPGMPGRYLMGIECDGATYHSSKSTRDRDRVRQGVLEGLGWDIMRIWSTDWFKNPTAELKPIIEALKAKATPISEYDETAPGDVAEEENQSTANDKQKQILEELLEEERVSSKSLRQRLTDFNFNIIVKQFPDTPDEKRLLRPDMMQFLESERPTDRDEFAEYVPAYLRTHTSPEEAVMFLEDVLEIIAVFEEIEGTGIKI